MNRRVVAVVVAVLVPLAVLGVVIVRRPGGAHQPARLPIVATGRSAAPGATGAADQALAPYGVIVYKADPNLPVLDGSARAYRVATNDTAGEARRIAGALELHGDPAPDGNGGFALTDGDAQLTVSPTSWGYNRTSSGSAVASSGVAVACPADATECPPDSIAPPPTAPPRPADLPSQDDAKSTALALLDRVGVDTKHAAVNVDDGITQWSIGVEPVVDGVATEGFSSSVVVGEKGVIEFAGGMLGAVVPADEYPLIGTKAAIERLNAGEGYIGPQPLWAEGQPAAGVASDANRAGPASGAPGSAPPASGAEPGGAPGSIASGEPTEPPAAPIPEPSSAPDGSEPPVTDTLPPPPEQDVTLTGAERILLFATSADGNEGWLVPAYRFSTADGSGPSVIAIDDRFLTPADAVKPAVKSAGVPAGQTDEGR